MATRTFGGKERGISRTQLSELDSNDEAFIRGMVDDCLNPDKQQSQVIEAVAEYFLRDPGQFAHFRNFLNKHPKTHDKPDAANIINKIRQKMAEKQPPR